MPFITSVERIGIEKGMTEGRRESILDFLKARFGAVPTDIKRKLHSISELDRLKELSLLAGTVTSLEEFKKEL